MLHHRGWYFVRRSYHRCRDRERIHFSAFGALIQ